MLKYLLIISFFVVQYSYAQQNIGYLDSLSGIVIYSQEIAIRELASTSDTLKFNRTKSIFSWNLFNAKNKISEDIKQRFPTAQIPEDISRITGQVNLFDYEQDSLFSRKSMRLLKRVILVKEKTPEINWQITDSTKKVGNYTARKATTYFRGRDYTAWFTPEIPVPYGPWKLHGLPGLILQAYDQSSNIYFSASNISFSDVGAIGPIPLNGEEEVLSISEYQKVINNFKSEMKNATFKQVRSIVSNKEMADMKFHFPDFELMETFEDSTDQ